MMGHGGMGWGALGSGGMVAGSALFILALLVIAALVYVGWRASHGTRLFTASSEGRRDSLTTAQPSYGTQLAAETSTEDQAMGVLAARLASGEITPEDYRDRVDTLRTVRNQGTDPTAGMPYLGPEDVTVPNGCTATS